VELRKGACDYLCEMLQKGTQLEVSEAALQWWIFFRSCGAWYRKDSQIDWTVPSVLYMCSWVVEHLATPENTTELQGSLQLAVGLCWLMVPFRGHTLRVQLS
jgi:uncharacterized membrane protein YGL010W